MHDDLTIIMQVTLAEYDMKVKRKVMSDIEKLRKRNEERYSQEIRAAVEKIADRKASSEVLAKRKNQNLNTQTATILERSVVTQGQSVCFQIRFWCSWAF